MLDEWSERVHDQYEEHFKVCTQCLAVPKEKEPDGMCDEGRRVWQALEDFNNSDET